MRLTILAAAVILTLGGAACKKQAPAEARIDAALAPLIPSDTKLAACLRLDRLKETPLWAKYVAPRRVTMLEQFREMTGLDPLQDVWELVATTNGSRNLVFIRGKFGGQFGLEPRLDFEGAQRLSHKGYNIIHKEGGGVMFLNTGAAVAGRVDDLKAVVDNRDNPAEKPPARLFELVKNIPGGAHAWAVTLDGTSLLPNAPEDGPANNMAKVAASLGEGWMWADLSDGVKFHAEGAYPSGESARQINDALRGLTGIARLKTPSDQPDLLRVIDAFQVRTRDAVLFVDFNLPPDLVDRLAELLGNRVVRKG